MTTISRAQEMVAEFQEKLGLLERAEMAPVPLADSEFCCVLSILRACAERLAPIETPLSTRLHLELEELAEKYAAMFDGDEVAALDGAADQLYTLLGTAAVFDMPLEAAFLEVHKSNMTKEKQPDDPLAHRVRDKGPNYRPPDIAEVLTRHRKREIETELRGAVKELIAKSEEARR